MPKDTKTDLPRNEPMTEAEFHNLAQVVARAINVDTSYTLSRIALELHNGPVHLLALAVRRDPPILSEFVAQDQLRASETRFTQITLGAKPKV